MSCHIIVPSTLESTLREVGPAPSADSIRYRDVADAREYCDTFIHKLGRLVRRVGPKAFSNLILGFDLPMRERLAVGSIGGGFDQYGRPLPDPTGMPNNPYGGTCNPYAGGSGSQPDPGCPPRQNCQADILPFQSRGQAGFPLLGNGTYTTASFEVKPTTYTLLPGAFYFRAFDSAQNLIVGDVTSIQVGPTQQLLSNMALSSQVFADMCCEVPVAFERVTPQIPLVLTIGNAYSNQVGMQVVGVLWGDRNR